MEEDNIQQTQQMTVKLARQIAQMEVMNPEVLRVTATGRVFERCAAALRGQAGDFYCESRTSHQIATFWSHSWHGALEEDPYSTHPRQWPCGSVLGFAHGSPGDAALLV